MSTTCTFTSAKISQQSETFLKPRRETRSQKNLKMQEKGIKKVKDRKTKQF